VRRYFQTNIWNESLPEVSNDTGVTVVSFATTKNPDIQE